MSKSQTLRALVHERLTVAAEDIFVLFERWIVEYEEELCRSKEENQRKQQLLDKALYPRIKLVRGNVQTHFQLPSTRKQEIPESPGVKEEPEEQSSVKQEEEQLPVCVPESSAVCVKTEEFSLLQQRQSEQREETQGGDIRSETRFHLETETRHTEHSSDTDNDEHWEPFSCPAAQMETETDGDHYNQVQSRDRSTEVSSKSKSAPESTVHSQHMSDIDDKKKDQCGVCNKRFRSKSDLKRHTVTHKGERPYSCPICKKTFANKSVHSRHLRRHTEEKPYSCPICKKNFIFNDDLQRHLRAHTGDRPHSCAVCQKKFTQKCHLKRHVKTHTGEKNYCCTICDRAFSQKNHLTVHIMTVHG